MFLTQYHCSRPGLTEHPLVCIVDAHVPNIKMYFLLFTSSFFSSLRFTRRCVFVTYAKRQHNVASVAPHPRHTVPYHKRFKCFCLFPNVAQLHYMLKEMILYIGGTEFLPLSWLSFLREIKARWRMGRFGISRWISTLRLHHSPLLTSSTYNLYYVQNVDQLVSLGL